MIKSSFLFIGIFLWCTNYMQAQLPSLSKKESRDGWTLLFDGKSFNGWQKANGTPFNGTGWKIENGVMSTTGEGHGGDIVTTKEFSDFDLSLDFKLEKGANSGIKYFLIKNTSLGCEFQVIDDANHADAKLGINGNRTLAALYDLIAPGAGKVAKPLGEWNNIHIKSKGKHVEHWLNGKKVLEFERGSDMFKNAVAGSKFKTEKGFAEAERSPILLQEHGDVIYFRNIKIRNL
jgi:hypothetical protein